MESEEMFGISKAFKPEIFQGKHKSRNYFEGWYFKLVDESEENAFAVIPGISHGESAGDSYAFIQVIDASSYDTHWFKYDISEFKYSEADFSISIGENTFDSNHMSLNLDKGDFRVKGKLSFHDIVPFPKSILSPGIMGPFSFVPMMECYHGVVSICHRIEGSMAIGGREIDFGNGSGYIEKDWGKSFPEWWVWIQSNHFEEKNVSLMFSIAKVPWLKRHFTGFISFLRVEGRLYRFATYTGARINSLEYGNGNIKISVSDRKYSMTISGCYKESGILKAPKDGMMHRKIAESISSDVVVTLTDRQGSLIFRGSGKNAGMEIVGEELMQKWRGM
jgi:tocopherol cyclase